MLPQPVLKSHPGAALYARLLPTVTSWYGADENFEAFWPIQYSAGFAKPARRRPFAVRSWLINATVAAHNGVDAEVPPAIVSRPPSTMRKPVTGSAAPATSGVCRNP